jgi:hypothetical protein
MLFGKTSFTVQALAQIAASSLPWRSDGLVVLVRGARGALRWGAPRWDGKKDRRVLLLGDVPLIVGESDDYWCPTCEKLLALGAGREQVDQQTLEIVRQASTRTDAPLSRVVNDVSPLLRLLQDGVYVVSFVDHFPTNGQGEPFWSLSRQVRRLAASREVYVTEMALYRKASGFPSFLLPTQPFGMCDWNQVEKYRTEIRAGRATGGIAFWADGFLSALLDGHHRATAALLERMPLRCLTIARCTGIRFDDGKRFLMVWENLIPFETLPKEAVRLIERPMRAKPPAARALALGGEHEDAGADPHWPELLAAAKVFPDVEGVAALELVGDFSDERVRRLLESRSEREAGELWLVLHGLIASHDPRAIDVALRIGRGPWPQLWQEAFRFLATKRTPEVEKFFVEFIVRDEGAHPWLEKIATDYLATE